MRDRFVFAVIADSHFHPAGAPDQAVWASDRWFNDRNRAVAAAISAARPAFVIHLGDVPHPVPGLASHEAALDVAAATYADLGVPLHVAPGNHDVGDKPHAWLPAPGVSPAKHAAFQARWGAPWRSFDHGGCHFVLFDAPVLNSGLALEAEQWAWLEADLAAANGRIFAFHHYPLYLVAPDEPVHYDNLGEPARGRLLALFTKYEVEAAFAGHSHHFFWNRHNGTDLYIAPSTAFVRPGFTELARIGTGEDTGAGSPRADVEFGRNEAERLGFFFVHVTPEGHHLEHVRTHGAIDATGIGDGVPIGAGPPPPCPLGVTLRHAWDQVLDIPCDNLDPFVRKTARNDLALQVTWDLGIQLLRVPIGDLRQPETRARIQALVERGQRFVFFVAGLPDADTWALVRTHAALVHAVELIVPRTTLGSVQLPTDMPPLWLAILGRRDPVRDGVYFSHFAEPGFVPTDPELATLPPGTAAAVFRVPPEVAPDTAIAAARAACPVPVVAQVWLPRAGEGAAFTDDTAVADRVEAAFHAAVAHPEVVVLLDTLLDHDRGYFPRHGLCDRRTNPREAYFRLRKLTWALR